MTGEVPSVCEVNPSIPCELDPVFAKALAKDPGAPLRELRRVRRRASRLARRGRRSDRDRGARGFRGSSTAGRPVRRGPPWLWPLAGLVAVAAIGGGAAAALLGGGDDTGAAASAQPSVSVRTVTQPGTTVVTTAPAPPTTTAPPPTTAPAPAGDPHALNDRAWALMQQGDYASALPLLQQAVQELQGQTGDIYDRLRELQPRRHADEPREVQRGDAVSRGVTRAAAGGTRWSRRSTRRGSAARAERDPSKSRAFDTASALDRDGRETAPVDALRQTDVAFASRSPYWRS